MLQWPEHVADVTLSLNNTFSWRHVDIMSSLIKEEPLVDSLRIRAGIRRNIKTRKSVIEGKPDRIADLLEEAADKIEELEDAYSLVSGLYQRNLEVLQCYKGKGVS